MATLSGLHASADTNNQNAYTTASMDPEVDDLLIVQVGAMATVDAAPTLVDSLGGTYTRIATRTWSAGTHSIFLFVADQLCSGAALTMTLNHPTDASTGVIIRVAAAVGMERVGAAAVRQHKELDGAAAGTPAVTFDAATLAGNPLYGALIKTSATVATAPATWTAMTTETALATPTATSRGYKLDAGDTASTYTWGASVASSHGLIVIELDASPAPEDGRVIKVKTGGSFVEKDHLARVGGVFA